MARDGIRLVDRRLENHFVLRVVDNGTSQGVLTMLLQARRHAEQIIVRTEFHRNALRQFQSPLNQRAELTAFTRLFSFKEMDANDIRTNNVLPGFINRLP